MKRTTSIKDTVATYNDELSVIMATGDATTIEEASNPLAECGGNHVVDRDALLGLVHNQAPPPTTEIDASQNLPNAPHAPSGKARHTKEEAERLQKEHESYELKWAGKRDAQAYPRTLAEERRDSFAFRNKEGHRQRLDEEKRELEARNKEHESYELKWAGERDAHAYPRTLAEERRDSFAFRNEEGHRQREDEAIRIAREQQMEHESYELKWAGEKDAEAYKKKLEQEQRDSFQVSQ
jgi:hypothetical protein